MASMYNLAKSGQGKKTSDEMVAFYQNWIKKYPIVSIEDGLAENDWTGFQKQTAEQGNIIQVVGDDVFATNPNTSPEALKKRQPNTTVCWKLKRSWEKRQSLKIH